MQLMLAQYIPNIIEKIEPLDLNGEDLIEKFILGAGSGGQKQ